MKKAIKITAITLLSIVLALIVAAVCYVVYVAVQYYRIDDNNGVKTLVITNPEKFWELTNFLVVQIN